MAKPTHTVTHRNLYLAVEGKLQHMKEGKTLTLTSEQAKKLKGKVKAVSGGESADLTPKDKK